MAVSDRNVLAPVRAAESRGSVLAVTAAPATSTADRLSDTSRVSRWERFRLNAFIVFGSNPRARTDMVYGPPTSTTSNEYPPSSRERVEYRAPVLPLTRLISASATAAPDSSVTWPAMAAVVTPCARADLVAGSASNAKAHAETSNRFMRWVSEDESGKGLQGRGKNGRPPGGRQPTPVTIKSRGLCGQETAFEPEPEVIGRDAQED